MVRKPRAFFCYPSEPSLRRDTLTRAANLISGTGLVEGITWEGLYVTGRVLIDEITRAIGEAEVSVFDVTRPNQNVLFELGFAIGKDRKIWLLPDPSDEEAKRTWETLRTLTTIGYAAYSNSEQIRARFVRELPHQSETTIYRSSVVPNLRPVDRPRLFYLPSPYDTDASRAISERVYAEKGRGISVISADPSESSTYSLAWYAPRHLGRWFTFQPIGEAVPTWTMRGPRWWQDSLTGCSVL
jgi:hypothetical protein